MSEPRDTRSVGPRRTLRAVLAAACDAGSIAVLVYLVASRVFYDEFRLGISFDADRIILVMVVAGLTVLRRLTTRLDPRVTLASFTALAASGAGLILLPALGVNVADPIKSALFPIKSRLFAVVDRRNRLRAIHQLDDRYGYVHIPNAVDRARARGFTATSTIDADGHRTMPSPVSPRGTVVFLGDSFTFGWGVDDDETYPYVLATAHWADLRVVNAGVDGWGLTQFYLALKDMLARPPLPNAVIVSMIPHDLRRSHLRPPLLRGQRRRLELIDGVLVPRDLHDSLVRETPELLEKEARLARATLEAMTAATREKGVAFGVILLDDGADFPPDLIYALGRDGTATLDLTRLGQTGLAFDRHPDPTGHRKIAAAIASSLLAPLVYGRASDEPALDPNSHR